MSFLFLLISSLQKNWRKEQNSLLEARGWWGSEGAVGKGERWPNVCTYE
jgi:hypothetical protein